MSPADFAADPAAYLADMGWKHARLLPSGEWAGIQKMAYTTGLAVGLDWMGYRTRFCFDGPDQEADARDALAAWNGSGWPPGYWLKQKPEGISNPART